MLANGLLGVVVGLHRLAEPAVLVYTDTSELVHLRDNRPSGRLGEVDCLPGRDQPLSIHLNPSESNICFEIQLHFSLIK